MPTSVTGIRPLAPRGLGDSLLWRTRNTQAGFTLIEMLAVVVIMGAMLALIIPNLGFRRASALRDQARSLASQIELTRQLAVVTGKPHRLLIDIEVGSYGIERFDDPEATEEALPAVPTFPGARKDFDLSPPKGGGLEYRPVENHFARNTTLDPDFFFEGLETAEGWFDRGLVNIVFDRDGTTDSADLVISDLDGRMLVLEVRPLLDRVVIRDETG